MKYVYKSMAFAFILLEVSACSNQVAKEQETNVQPVKTEIKKQGDKFQLYVNGDPFFIKGAGIEFGEIEKLALHGGNSFRTWRTDNGKQSGKEVLEQANKYGLKVTMGIEIGRERHGFDYDSEEQVKAQFDHVRKQVMELKDQPALIIWAIGNELNLRATNPKVWNAVNDISKMIHEIDPNHLTTTTLAGINIDLIQDIKERASDLDLLSVQMYGDIVNLPRYIKETGWEGPYIVTEWGASGHWEVAKTAWGAPIENNSTVKANYYLDRYKTAIEPEIGHCLGSYVFLWGQKQERTPTWYGIFMQNGNETESVDVMHFIWNNEWPTNKSPKLLDFKLDGKTAYDNIYLDKNIKYSASAKVEDMDGDPIEYVWNVMAESTDLGDGGDFESTPPSMPELISGNGDLVEVTTPSVSGAYRLFIYANDGQGHAAHANIPFYVK